MTIFDTTAPGWRRRVTGTLASTAMIAAGFVALAGPANAAGNTIYVNAAGSGAADCGASFKACRSIQAGINNAAAGDTVEVAAGTYSELVDINKSVTVHGAGAASTIIDGAGKDPGNDGVVDIANPAGNVTFTGFTVKNQAPSGNGDAFALTVIDPTAADTVTVSNNVFPGSTAQNDNFVYGINSNGTAAKLAITDNEFSGMSRGILLEGNSGPATITNNTFHDLTTTDAGNGQTYPPKAIYFLVDGNLGASGQNSVANNTFRDFGGIGVSIRAGYDLGGCADRTCDGTFSGTVSDNSFALTAPAATSVTTDNQQSAAVNVSALSEVDRVNLVLSGNTGTVAGPTRPLVVAGGAGTVDITPGATPNKIVPTPAPVLSVPLPSTILTNGVVKTFSASATNNSGETITNARYGVSITGTKGITASQIKLQYDADPSEGVSFMDVPLTGTASASNAITGFFGPAAGFPFPSSATPNVTDFKLSFPDSTTPPDTLTTTVTLDQVSSATGNPVINTVATTSSTTVVSAPTPATVSVSSAAFAAQISATDTTAVTATITDDDGSPLAGQTVTFTVDNGFVSSTSAPTSTTAKTATATSTASGVATAYVGSTTAGTQTITATAGDKSGTATKAYYANPATLTLVPTSTSLQAGSKQTFTATVKDVVGNPSPNTGVAFSIASGPGLLNKANAITDANGVATVTLTTATDDIGSGTVKASVFSFPPLEASSAYTVTAPSTPVAVASVTPTVVAPLSRAGSGQSVSIKVVNNDGTAPAAGTEVDVLVSGNTVTNGTVFTNAAGVASFRFVLLKAGSLTVKAVAGGKSGTTTVITPVRNVTTTLSLTSPSKGTIVATAVTSPARAGKYVGFYFLRNGVNQLYGSAVTNSKGVATRTIPSRVSGTTYVLTARLYGDPDSDSVYSAPKSIRVK